MVPGAVIEDFNVIEDTARARFRILYILFLMRSFFSELKNDSATVLTLLCQEWTICMCEIR